MTATTFPQVSVRELSVWRDVAAQMGVDLDGHGGGGGINGYYDYYRTTTTWGSARGMSLTLATSVAGTATGPKTLNDGPLPHHHHTLTPQHVLWSSTSEKWI